MSQLSPGGPPVDEDAVRGMAGQLRRARNPDMPDTEPQQQDGQVGVYEGGAP